MVVSLDPGETTGWALLRKKDRELLGTGDFAVEDVGAGLDLIVRSLHLAGYTVEAVVEQMPVPALGGQLPTTLEFVRRTINHWLSEIYELSVTYVLPGTWKNSRTALTTTVPDEWNGTRLSQHQKDAILMAHYYARKR